MANFNINALFVRKNIKRMTNLNPEIGKKSLKRKREAEEGEKKEIEK